MLSCSYSYSEKNTRKVVRNGKNLQSSREGASLKPFVLERWKKSVRPYQNAISLSAIMAVTKCEFYGLEEEYRKSSVGVDTCFVFFKLIGLCGARLTEAKFNVAYQKNLHVTCIFISNTPILFSPCFGFHNQFALRLLLLFSCSHCCLMCLAGGAKT